MDSSSTAYSSPFVDMLISALISAHNAPVLILRLTQNTQDPHAQTESTNDIPLSSSKTFLVRHLTRLQSCTVVLNCRPLDHGLKSSAWACKFPMQFAPDLFAAHHASAPKPNCGGGPCGSLLTPTGRFSRPDRSRSRDGRAAALLPSVLVVDNVQRLHSIDPWTPVTREGRPQTVCSRFSNAYRLFPHPESQVLWVDGSGTV